MLSRILCLTLSFMLMNKFASAQNNDYSAQWKKIEAFEKKGLTKDALKETVSIFNDAVARGNEPQQIKAAMYQMKYRNMTEEENNEKNIFFIDTLISKTKVPAKNILISMQAQLFQAYKENHRYQLYNRTALTEEKGNDITTWSLTKLNNKIASLYKASLNNDNLLKQTDLKKFSAILEKEKNTAKLRPTLYDLLANRALDYFMITENDVTQPTYKFIINDEAAFAPAAAFINKKFVTADSSALYYNALVIMQDLLRFHLKDAQPDALLDADLKRLQFVHEHGIFPNKEKLYEDALLNIESVYGNNELSAQATYLRALIYKEKGGNFKPADPKTKVFQFDLVKARDLAQAAFLKFPKSSGGIDCRNLVLQIQQPVLHFETEKVNIPDQPFRSLIEYANTDKIYFRLVKTTHDDIKNDAENETDSDKRLAAILKMSALRSWNTVLPDQKDYQQHSVEIKADGVPSGVYYMIVSRNADFNMKKNIIGRSVIYVSNIAYITNTKNELYALNRDNGLPLENAGVQLWKNSYNNAKRKYEYQQAGTYKTDKNGYAKIAKQTNYESYVVQIKYGADELFTDDNLNTYCYNSYAPKKETEQTFLFTDRSIYRPGQTVFFKGITTSTDTTRRKSHVVSGRSTIVMLFDNNGQKIQSLALRTNEYGSYNGKFIIPEGLLNGQFYVIDSLNNSRVYFNVEEYKRPKFSTEIKKPQGSYRVNDSITIKGNAKAYAGNNIDGAKVSYRVVRAVRYPIWFGYSFKRYPPMGSEEDMEITEGVTTTDANGEFTVTFKAIPDETIDKKDQPTFDYKITADVTDINGETISGEETVSVSYQALQLNITGEDELPADSIKNIGVSSTNANGLFEKVTVKFEMYKLQEPNRIFRKRYWDAPDQFVMTKEESYRDFPYDVYADENEMSNWALGQKVIDATDTTSSNSTLSTKHSTLIAGWYKIIVTTKDKYGEDVRAEKFIQITDRSASKINEAFSLQSDKKTAQPGDAINYNLATGYDKIWLIRNLLKANDNIRTDYVTVTGDKESENILNVTEDDRGGISVNYAFVKHNRSYNGTESFAIPWSNKELKISYETFRDKLLPGAEEKWTIKITGDKAEKVTAETLISMYDASIDQFKDHSWSSLSRLWPSLKNGLNWTAETFREVSSAETNNLPDSTIEQDEMIYPALVDNGWSDGSNFDGFAWTGRATYKVVNKNAATSATTLYSVSVGAMGIRQDEASRDRVPLPENADSNNPHHLVIPKPVLGGGATDNATGGNVSIRKNFNETAFFFPDLKTDEDGNVSFSFTMPEALTKWKLMVMAHTKELASAYSTNSTVTQKELMVQPNAPRFLREGDDMEFSAKVVNLTDKEITGTSQLELIDAATNQPVDGWFKNVFPNQYFTVPAGQSVAVKFPMAVPFNFNSAMFYRIKAISKDGSFSDGEEMAIPVLTNRMLVTESMPLNMRNTDSKTFTFDKLLTSGNSGSLTNHALTVEYTSNPAWYAVQALPYLIEYPYECAEQSFNRYYANTLASFISNSSPRIKAVFEKWKITDTSALMSNLQKNEELKSVLLQETPWVLEAKDETQQKKNIALLFDMVRLAGEKNRTLAKLKDMQTSNGGFAWFKGGADDQYITQYIITGIGHLRKLNALQGADYEAIKPILDKALPYLDARIKEEYDNLIKYKAKMSDDHLSYNAIQYLYMRSFFPETKVTAASNTAASYFRGQAAKYWLSKSKYMQAMVALALNRNGDTKTSQTVIASLKQNAINNEEFGMYWKDLAIGGYYWYQAPIESQAMMIEAFTDIDKNVATINDMKTWLLKQKQTQQWPTTKATAEACYALLLNGSDWLSEEKVVTIQLGNTVIKSTDEKTEAGTGYFKKRIEGSKVQQGMGNIKVSLSSPTNQPINKSTTSYGAVYWQYFEDLDKITSAATPLKLVKKLYIEKNSATGPVLTLVKDGDQLKVGDKIKVRIELRADRDMEYVHMKDMRAACMEPVNVISSYKYRGGLGYYESTKDASTNFFFSWLPKGTYVFEYPMFVTLNGNFSNGITTIQCMYAPEFTSHSEGVRVQVGN